MNVVVSQQKAGTKYTQPSAPEVLNFVDFGCGTGRSMAFANSASPGSGLGIDNSMEAVAACRTKGYDAEHGDLLTYEQKNIAAASFAIDVMQELPGRHDLTTACVNLIRAARNFTIIQHAYFDMDPALAPLGLHCEANFTKKILHKPSIADYAVFARTHAKALGIVGVAAFTFGDPVITPIFDRPAAPPGPEIAVARTLRIVFARKDPKRFERALKVGGIGRTMLLWTAD